MKKHVAFLITFALLANGGLLAQEAPAAKTPDAPVAAQSAASVPAATAPDTTGSSAAQSTQTAGSNANWHNWVFAGTGLAIAAVGAIIISLDSGESAH